MSLKISGKGTPTTKETGGVTEKQTPAADINTKAISVASQAMKNHPLGRSSSSCDDHETEPHDFRSQDIYMDELSANYSLMPPNLTDSEYDSESDTETDTPEEHHR